MSRRIGSGRLSVHASNRRAGRGPDRPGAGRRVDESVPHADVTLVAAGEPGGRLSPGAGVRRGRARRAPGHRYPVHPRRRRSARHRPAFDLACGRVGSPLRRHPALVRALAISSARVASPAVSGRVIIAPLRACPHRSGSTTSAMSCGRRRVAPFACVRSHTEIAEDRLFRGPTPTPPQSPRPHPPGHHLFGCRTPPSAAFGSTRGDQAHQTGSPRPGRAARDAVMNADANDPRAPTPSATTCSPCCTAAAPVVTRWTYRADDPYAVSLAVRTARSVGRVAGRPRPRDRGACTGPPASATSG